VVVAVAERTPRPDRLASEFSITVDTELRRPRPDRLAVLATERTLLILSAPVPERVANAFSVTVAIEDRTPRPDRFKLAE
jgi:hypothetical protein